MMVDDAHASGVFGRNGRGTIDHFGMHGRVDIQVGTLSKAIGALGGYVAGSRDAHRVPVPPRAAVPVLDVASAGGRRRLHRGDRRAARGAADHRAAVGEHAVLQGRPAGARLQHRRQREPDHAGHRRRRRAGDEAVGSAVRRRACSRRASRSRPWPRDKARVRTIVTATHTRDELQFALDVFAKVGRELGIV